MYLCNINMFILNVTVTLYGSNKSHIVAFQRVNAVSFINKSV